MRTTHQIHYRGLLLDVVGERNYEPQGEFTYFELHEVYLGGTEISPLFDDITVLEKVVHEEHY